MTTDPQLRSHKTNGIDPDTCNRVLVEHCHQGTLPVVGTPEPSVSDSSRCTAHRVEAPSIEFPAGKRPMAGRHATPICHAQDGPPTVLHWAADSARIDGPTLLRLTAAVDERVPHTLDAANANSGESYGTVEILFAAPGQVYGLPLDARQTAASLRDGLALSLVKPTTPFWIVDHGPNAPDSVLPHLAAISGPPTLGRFLELFCSPASIQPCDWMGVCVVDGLRELSLCGQNAAATMLKNQLELWFDADTGRREDFRGRPNDAKPGGPETTGPFALLAMLYPNHPALALAEEGFRHHYSSVVDAVGEKVVAETSYNIAYPMMALAVYSNKEEYHEKAIRQLEVNQQYLAEDDVLWLRYVPKTKERTFKSWSRGVAWYFLGLVRTLTLLSTADRPPHLVDEAVRMAAWVARRQSGDGLWPCFFDEPDILPDTSGSSGIAAALALGVLHGMFDDSHLSAARRAHEALINDYLDPDGWLRGASQSNKGETVGIDIQRIRFRVIAPWGMGLFAQLTAALHQLEPR